MRNRIDRCRRICTALKYRVDLPKKYDSAHLEGLNFGAKMSSIRVIRCTPPSNSDIRRRHYQNQGLLRIYGHWILRQGLEIGDAAVNGHALSNHDEEKLEYMSYDYLENTPTGQTYTFYRSTNSTHKVIWQTSPVAASSLLQTFVLYKESY